VSLSWKGRERMGLERPGRQCSLGVDGVLRNGRRDEAGKAWIAMASSGERRHRRQGPVGVVWNGCHGESWNVDVWQRSQGWVRLGLERGGMAGHGQVAQSRYGASSSGSERRGVATLGTVGRGSQGQVRSGTVVPVGECTGEVRHGHAGEDRNGRAGQVMSAQSRYGMGGTARHGPTWNRDAVEGWPGEEW
jgi:hypothetical protein